MSLVSNKKIGLCLYMSPDSHMKWDIHNPIVCYDLACSGRLTKNNSVIKKTAIEKNVKTLHRVFSAMTNIACFSRRILFITKMH